MSELHDIAAILGYSLYLPLHERWKHPQQGNESPIYSQFIAEVYGFQERDQSLQARWIEISLPELAQKPMIEIELRFQSLDKFRYVQIPGHTVSPLTHVAYERSE